MNEVKPGGARRALPLETITAEAFAPFGTVVDWSAALERTGQPFHVLVRSAEPTGWRLAVSRVTVRTVERLGNHPATEELFAPLQGSTVILVAPHGPFDVSKVRAFLLDRPVCVGRGVWHANLALSAAATVLIAENLDVTSEIAVLRRPLGVQLG
jgi:ureidoglycolate hydrolase